MGLWARRRLWGRGANAIHSSSRWQCCNGLLAVFKQRLKSEYFLNLHGAPTHPPARLKSRDWEAKHWNVSRLDTTTQLACCYGTTSMLTTVQSGQQKQEAFIQKKKKNPFNETNSHPSVQSLSTADDQGPVPPPPSGCHLHYRGGALSWDVINLIG